MVEVVFVFVVVFGCVLVCVPVRVFITVCSVFYVLYVVVVVSACVFV